MTESPRYMYLLHLRQVYFWSALPPSHALWVSMKSMYSITCLKRPLKLDKANILMKNGSLTKVKSIAECSSWSILQYSWPALSDSRS